MRIVRANTKDKFEQIRQKAKGIVKSKKGCAMGPIKGFGELQDSILKIREHFDSVVLGKTPSAYPPQKEGQVSFTSCTANDGNDSCC